MAVLGTGAVTFEEGIDFLDQFLVFESDFWFLYVQYDVILRTRPPQGHVLCHIEASLVRQKLKPASCKLQAAEATRSHLDHCDRDVAAIHRLSGHA